MPSEKKDFQIKITFNLFKIDNESTLFDVLIKVSKLDLLFHLEIILSIIYAQLKCSFSNKKKTFLKLTLKNALDNTTDILKFVFIYYYPLCDINLIY